MVIEWGAKGDLDKYLRARAAAAAAAAAVTAAAAVSVGIGAAEEPSKGGDIMTARKGDKEKAKEKDKENGTQKDAASPSQSSPLTSTSTSTSTSASVIPKSHLIPEATVVSWLAQLALALDYLHSKHILHRDIKTPNIFIAKDDTLKVRDILFHCSCCNFVLFYISNSFQCF